MGILLLVFAAGLFADAIQNLQALGWLAQGSAPLWNTGSLLSEASTLGDLLHTFLGYAQAPTVLQVIMYLTYLSLTGTLFWRLTRKPPAASASSTCA